jgi:predicted nucleotidyltransferase
MPKVANHPVAPRTLDRIVKRIVHRFHPEHIILFGSRARGDAGPGSDIDLLVVMPFQGSSFEKMLEIASSLGDSAIGVDIVVTRPEDFAWRKEFVGTIEYPASKEGRIVYARS